MNRLGASQLRFSELPVTSLTEFEIVPDKDRCAAIAAELDLIGLRKLRFSGHVAPFGKSDWDLHAELGATVVQPCGVTLEPVTTRLDETVTRRFLAEMPEVLGAEVEMPEDDSAEELPAVLDLEAVMIEALALELPAYPRAEGANLGEAIFGPDGVSPLKDEDTKPFAGLSALRQALENKD